MKYLPFFIFILVNKGRPIKYDSTEIGIVQLVKKMQ